MERGMLQRKDSVAQHMNATAEAADTWNYNEPDGPHNIQFEPTEQGKIKSITFPKLIQKLTSAKNYDANLLHEVMLTYHSFTTSKQLLAALIKRYETVPNDPDRPVVYIRLFNVLRHWVDNYWHDFTQDPQLIGSLELFLDRVIKDNIEVTRAPAQSVSASLVAKLNNQTKKLIQTAIGAPKPIFPRVPNCDILEVDPEEIARQLTLIEWELFVNIQPWECYGLAWTKKDREQRAPGIIAITGQFNYVSRWVTTAICTEEDQKKRVELIKKFIKIAEHLKNMANVNGLLEIISGLGQVPVFRLDKTWEEVDSKARRSFVQMQELTHAEKNYKRIREFLKGKSPAIPFIGVYLTDLTFIEEGHKNTSTVNENLINFTKRRQTAETIRKIRDFQAYPYPYEAVQSIQAKLRNLRILDEPTLDECSYWIQPRLNTERGPKPDAMNINYRPPEDIRFDLEIIKDYPFYAADDPTNIRVEKESNQIKGGTLPKIIERLTHHKTPDGASLPTFLATYRTFTTPHEVLDLLIWRYSMPACRDRSPDTQTKFKELMLVPVTTRVFNVLKLWVEKHYYDFEADPELKKKLINFIETKLAGSTWQGLMKNLIAKREGQPGLVSAGSTLTRKEKPPAPILTCTCPPNFTPTIFDYHPEEVGRQMTLMLHDLYVQIRPPEFITMAQKFRRAALQAKQAHDPDLYIKAANGMALQSAANRIRNWLESEVQASRRSGTLAPLISQLLDIAASCSRLNNHLTLKTIISVLEKTYIKELQPVWMSIEIDKRKFFFDNKELMSRNNYAKYKERLKMLSPPAVPYLATFLEEIAMIEDDLPDIVSERMINFQKKHAIGELLVKLQAMQSIPYMLVIVDPIQNLITRIFNGTPPQSPQLLSMSGSFMRNTESNMVRYTEVPADEVKRSLIDLVQNDTEMKNMLRTLITETLSEEMAQLNLLLRSDSNY